MSPANKHEMTSIEMVDTALVGLYVVAHSYAIMGPISAIASMLVFFVGIANFQLSMVAVTFGSYFVSDFLVTKRILRGSDDTTRRYVTLALTVILIICAILSITGGIEPYQAALACLGLYIFQARYRTSRLAMSSTNEHEELASLPLAYTEKS
tara:strand:- start:1208 stop:1666 length:459 start_codon:yes stop_codon:yes gene_type:complete